MEELRSTAIIDSEILEDSRKKAERILSNSQNECKSILSSVAQRVAEITKEKTNYYLKKVESHKKDLTASFPLERKRYLVEYEKNEIQNAIVDYLASLSTEKKLLIIKKLATRYKSYLHGHKLIVKVAGFKKEEVLSILKSELNADSILECVEMDSVMKTTFKSEYGEAEGMIIETEDKSRLCRVFIGEVVERLIDTNNYELATALFCGRLPE